MQLKSPRRTQAFMVLYSGREILVRNFRFQEKYISKGMKTVFWDDVPCSLVEN
jgi:hypothetical protein